MKQTLTLAAATGAALLLAACGSADDASTEARADTVEMPADEALEPVAEEPVADPTAAAEDPGAVTDQTTEQAAEAAANVAAEAAAAASAAEAVPGE
ncbi:MAG: hypothetical protein MUF47_03070 [Porphyrobacter sp.]|jgi:hypothetical protein|nr:hypothetical protein [Porphyrobacter sp.]